MDAEVKAALLNMFRGRQLFCPIAGCGIKLKGVGELESHYLSRHSATCSVCTRVFPTIRLLNLHVSETHDSFFQAKVARNYPMVSPPLLIYNSVLLLSLEMQSLGVAYRTGNISFYIYHIDLAIYQYYVLSFGLSLYYREF